MSASCQVASQGDGWESMCPQVTVYSGALTIVYDVYCQMQVHNIVIVILSITILPESGPLKAAECIPLNHRVAHSAVAHTVS